MGPLFSPPTKAVLQKLHLRGPHPHCSPTRMASPNSWWGGVGKRDGKGIHQSSCAVRAQRAQESSRSLIAHCQPQEKAMERTKQPPFFWGGRGGGDPLAAQRTISDSKEGEEASLRGGFSILLLSGDELSLLQGQIHLLLRVVVVELADVGDEGPGMGGGGVGVMGGGCRASAAGQHAPHCPPQHSSRAP